MFLVLSRRKDAYRLPTRQRNELSRMILYKLSGSLVVFQSIDFTFANDLIGQGIIKKARLRKNVLNLVSCCK